MQLPSETPLGAGSGLRVSLGPHFPCERQVKRSPATGVGKVQVTLRAGCLEKYMPCQHQASTEIPKLPTQVPISTEWMSHGLSTHQTAPALPRGELSAQPPQCCVNFQSQTQQATFSASRTNHGQETQQGLQGAGHMEASTELTQHWVKHIYTPPIHAPLCSTRELREGCICWHSMHSCCREKAF